MWILAIRGLRIHFLLAQVSHVPDLASWILRLDRSDPGNMANRKNLEVTMNDLKIKRSKERYERLKLIDISLFEQCVMTASAIGFNHSLELKAVVAIEDSLVVITLNAIDRWKQ
jgi:hypothetical protein